MKTGAARGFNHCCAPGAFLLPSLPPPVKPRLLGDDAGFVAPRQAGEGFSHAGMRACGCQGRHGLTGGE